MDKYAEEKEKYSCPECIVCGECYCPPFFAVLEESTKAVGICKECMEEVKPVVKISMRTGIEIYALKGLRYTAINGLLAAETFYLPLVRVDGEFRSFFTDEAIAAVKGFSEKYYPVVIDTEEHKVVPVEDREEVKKYLNAVVEFYYRIPILKKQKKVDGEKETA